MVKEYETKNLWAIFPPPIASIMQFTAEFIQQKRICLRALWYFFPQHICINWCLLLTFRIGLYTEDLVIALFIGGKKRYNTLRPDSSGVPLRILLNLQWEQTATACRPQKQGNHSPQPLYAARQDSRTHKDSKRNVHEYTHTHKFIIYIHTHAKPAESADDGAHKFSFSKFRMQVSMYVCVRACVDKDLSRKKVVLAATANKKCWIWASNHQPIWNMLHLWGRCTLRRSLMVALKRTPAINPFLA